MAANGQPDSPILSKKDENAQTLEHWAATPDSKNFVYTWTRLIKIFPQRKY